MTATAANHDQVIGMDEELSSLLGFLEATDDLPGTLVIEGEPGAGKTTLFGAALLAAQERGYRILRCSPAESEQSLSFAPLRDLLEDAFDEAGPALPPPQRRALAVALLREDPVGSRPEAGAVAVGLLGLLRVLASEDPLLLAVDDIQWLDASTTTVLGYGVRRLLRERIAVLLTRRTGPDLPIGPALDRALREHRLQRLSVRPLSVGAIHVLLRAKLGVSLPRPILRRLHETAGGNPFFALEIGRVLQARGGTWDMGEPLPVPPTLSDLVHQRISRLSVPTRHFLPAVAALARPTVETLRKLDGEAAVLEGVEAGILVRQGNRVRFSHPLLAAHVYGKLTEDERRGVHARLGRVVSDREERARHLARATERPDPKIASALEEAARTALARGAPAAAAELAKEAIRLTPGDRQEDAWRRSIESARYDFQAGDAEQASGTLRRVVDGLSSGSLRAEALVALARIHIFADDLRSAVAAFERAVDEPSTSTAVRMEAGEGLAWSLILAREQVPEAARHARRAVSLADQLADELARAEASAVQGVAEFLLGRQGAQGRIQRAVAVARGSEYPRVIRHPEWALAVVKAWGDDLEGAGRDFEALREHAVERGDESSLPRLLFALSHVHLLSGDWQKAVRYAEDGQEAAHQRGQPPEVGMLLFSKAIVEAHLGAVDEARELAVPTGADRAVGDVAGMVGRIALGFLEMSLGNAEEADRQLSSLVEHVFRAGIVEPGAQRFVPDEIEALINLGRLEEAEALLNRLEASAVKVNRHSAKAASGRCRALLHAARGNLPAAIEAFGLALAEHDRVAMPFERARTLLVQGIVLRRAKQRGTARMALEEAAATFDALGARLWAKKARIEASRLGGRVRSGDLTPTERRVAEMVAEGRSNREVASELFVTVKTVEATLTRVYTKLGIRSRTSLARHFAELSTTERPGKV